MSKNFFWHRHDRFWNCWYVANVQRRDQELEEAGKVPQPLFHYLCLCHPATPSCLYRVLCSTWYLRRYITICFPQTYVATYSCLITFGSLASGRRKFGAWLEPAMRDSRWSTVGKGTPSCNLHRSTMDSNMVLYGNAAQWKGLGASPDRYLESGE